jgi:23S rRNA (pseudouridine1915-N3)-methyltransferase
MNIALAHVGSKNPSWLEALAQSYDKKLNMIIPFERRHIRSINSERQDKDYKLEVETKSLLKSLPLGEHLVLFSEEGRSFDSSKEFSLALVKLLAMQPGKVCLVIGGAYGFSSEVKGRAKAIWSLSHLTLNHHLAQAVVLEQIYRALTIWKGLPYHN